MVIPIQTSRKYLNLYHYDITMRINYSTGLQTRAHVEVLNWSKSPVIWQFKLHRLCDKDPWQSLIWLPKVNSTTTLTTKIVLYGAITNWCLGSCTICGVSSIARLPHLPLTRKLGKPRDAILPKASKECIQYSNVFVDDQAVADFFFFHLWHPSVSKTVLQVHVESIFFNVCLLNI